MFVYSCVRFKFDCASYSDVFAGLCSTSGCVHTFILGTFINRWCSYMWQSCLFWSELSGCIVALSNRVVQSGTYMRELLEVRQSLPHFGNLAEYLLRWRGREMICHSHHRKSWAEGAYWCHWIGTGSDAPGGLITLPWRYEKTKRRTRNLKLIWGRRRNVIAQEFHRQRLCHFHFTKWLCIRRFYLPLGEIHLPRKWRYV